MRIYVISHGPSRRPDKMIGWHYIPYILEQSGHKIRIVSKKEWKRFYWEYLKFKPDVIVSSGIIGAWITLFKKLRLISKKVPHYHAWDDHYVEVMGKKWGPAMTAFFEYWIVKNADFVSSPSVMLYRQTRQIGVKNSAFTPHGVYSYANSLKPIPLPKGKFKVSAVYVGEQSGAQKNLEKFLLQIRDVACDIYLIGERNPELAKFVEVNNIENIHFLGGKENKEVIGLLKSADILLLTPDQDSCLKMYEYLKVGKAILGYKGRQGYILSHNENAYLCEDFNEGLRKLVKDLKLRKRLSTGAKKFKVLTWEEIARKHLNNMERVVRNRK